MPLLGLVFIVLASNGMAAVTDSITVISDNGIDVVAGHVRVIFRNPFFRDSDIPPGFALRHRFLKPEQTLLINADPTVQQLNKPRMQTELRLLSCAVLRYETNEHPSLVSRRLRKDPNIVWAEPWYVMHTQHTPNDALFGQQLALNVLGMQEAWNISKGNKDVVVAIIDNGVDQTHEDLQPMLWTNTSEIPNNGLDDDGNGVVDDYRGCNLTWNLDGTEAGNTFNSGAGGHGTNVAGISSAATNNGLGIAGIAYNCLMFPIKTSLKNTGAILFGTEALLYAAQMGFRVANCSWGTSSSAGSYKPYSFVDQYIIDYCIARGMVVTAAAGNHGNGVGGSGWRELNYPAAYDGVIGTGETTTSDKVTATSGLAGNAWIMAPGNSATTTTSSGGYTSSNIQGSSFAAPMSAGAAALLCAHRPNLTPRQIAAVLRSTGTDITDNNPSVAKYLPRRLNVAKALQVDPTSIPGLRIKQLVVRNTRGEMITRYGSGDTVMVWFRIVNELGGSEPYTFTASVLDPAGWLVALQSATIQHGTISSGAEVEVGPWTAIIHQMRTQPVAVALDYVSGDHYDRLFAYLYPGSVMATFANNALSFSIGDNGMFAYASTFSNNTMAEGTGVGWLPFAQDLAWVSGLLFTENNARALKAFNNQTDISDFSPEKRFVSPDERRGVCTDVNAGNRTIGVRVKQHCTFPTADGASAVIAIEIENISNETLTDPSIGYLFDWDVGPSGVNNTVREAPEALPVSFREMGSALMFQRESFPIVVVCAAVSNELNIQPQAAGMMMSDIVADADQLTDADVIKLLNSGTSVMTTASGDACGVVGMKFSGSLPPGASKRCMIVFGVGPTPEAAAAVVRQSIETPNSVGNLQLRPVHLYPNPATHQLQYTVPEGAYRSTITDVLGNCVWQQQSTVGEIDHIVDLSNLAPGRYMLRAYADTFVYQSSFVVIR